MVADESVNFVFSFDSLVHADELVLAAYIKEFKRILTDNGVAFIHHSNLGEYQATYSIMRRIPKLTRLLRGIGVLGALTNNSAWRDFSVDAKKVANFTEKNGLNCISQELIPWWSEKIEMEKLMIYCISTIGKNLSIKSGNVVRNYKFNEEVKNLKALSRIYYSPVMELAHPQARNEGRH
jgi:hypothetical protein